MRFENVLRALGIVMALAYVAVGAAVLFQPEAYFSIPKPLVLPVGIALLCYGLFRSYRLYIKYFKR
jgi:hypothetical protein